MNLKILSWNIWIDGQFDQITDFLKSCNADVIALQEVQADVPGRDIISNLSKLGYDYAFAPVQKSWGGKVYNDGPAIFSKYTIKEKQAYILSEESPRAAVMASIDVHGKTVNIFCTHLVHTHQQPSELQNRQGENLVKVLTKEKTILMGDFNAAPNSEVVQSMQKILVDADPLSQPTWSVYEEGCKVCKIKDVKIRLDYIFTSIDIKTNSFKVESSKASDHLPISVNIEI